MTQKIWSRIKDEINVWRVGTLPGFFVIALIIIARLTGSLQWLEWIALDTFLRIRPREAVDERIVIVGINEGDINSLNQYPIPDKELADLFQTLQKYKPRAIGLDIIRDRPVAPGYAELAKVFKQSKNIFGIEKVLANEPIAPPPALPPEQIGFSDAIPDLDGKYRRNLLWTINSQNKKQEKYSLSLRLAEAYLSGNGITIENGKLDPDAIRFGSTELTRFLTNSGGYVGTDAGGIQILINWRNRAKPFRVLSLQDIKNKKIEPNLVRDRIVIIGLTASSTSDYINTSAVPKLELHGSIYGVEFQAHACSQIISAVLDGRPLLRYWSEIWEYMWILSWGLFGIIVGRFTQSSLKTLLAIGVVNFCLILIGYIFIFWGLWIPIVPVLLMLPINLVSALSYNEYIQNLKSKNHEIATKKNIIAAKQNALERAFSDIHVGPMQTLAVLMRDVQNQPDFSKQELLNSLKKVRDEIDKLGQYLQGENLNEEESLCLGSDLIIDLKLPFHELLSEVYNSTLQRNLPCFQKIKKPICDFEPIENKQLSIELKREICRFLEEALCNVGKHATGATIIEATGKNRQSCYTLTIKDNGPGIRSLYESKGTKDSKNLAKKIGGTFKRESISPQGTLCELTWHL